MRHGYRSGFTIIEVLVVIVIMVVLLGLSVVNMAGQQAVGRDNERRQDAENIARGLERYYSEVAKPSVNKVGRYPDRATAINDVVANNILPDVEPASLYFSFNSGAASSFTVIGDATGTTPATDAAAISAINTATTTSTIVYVPMRWSGTYWEMCGTDEECTRFSLYYRTEQDSGVTQVIQSRYQQ